MKLTKQQLEIIISNTPNFLKGLKSHLIKGFEYFGDYESCGKNYFSYYITTNNISKSKILVVFEKEVIQ